MPSDPGARLRELGLELPAVPEPAGSYVPATRTGSLIFTAGQLPFEEGELRTTGKVGDEVSLEEAREAARLCALNALATAAAEAGGLSRIARVVKLTGFVASASNFNRQPEVINGADRRALRRSRTPRALRSGRRGAAAGRSSRGGTGRGRSLLRPPLVFEPGPSLFRLPILRV